MYTFALEIRLTFVNKNSTSVKQKEFLVSRGLHCARVSLEKKVWTSGISSYVDQQATPSDPAALV